MQLHQLRPQTRPKRGRRVGRGGKRGKTSGRGTKGQKARAGHKIRPALRDVIKKIPKKRGYRFRSFRPHPVSLDLATLVEYFQSGDIIDPAALLKKKLIRRIKGRMPAVKILGSAPFKKKFVLRGLVFSKAAQFQIKEAGGTIK